MQLDQNKIGENAGLRLLAKLMLNSFWGIFGARQNRCKTLVTRDPEELLKLVVNPGLQNKRSQRRSSSGEVADCEEVEVFNNRQCDPSSYD